MESTSKRIIFQNKTGTISLGTNANRDWSVLHVHIRACERINTADGNELLSALGAFYELNEKVGITFVNVFDVNSEHVPDFEIIMSTIALVRKTHLHFAKYLICSFIIAHNHASACRSYLRGFVPTKQIEFIEEFSNIDYEKVNAVKKNDVQLAINCRA